MLRHQRAGRRMSFLLPYGMKKDLKDPTKLKINFDEQRAIKRMIELHKADLSFRAITRQLTEEGIKPRKVRRIFKGRYVFLKGKWRNDLIARIIRRKEDPVGRKPVGCIATTAVDLDGIHSQKPIYTDMQNRSVSK